MLVPRGTTELGSQSHPNTPPPTLLISWGPSGNEGADWPISLCRAWTPQTCQTGL